jgi:putative membrane protein
MGMAALFVFTLLLSLSFEKDMTYLIAAFTFMSGASITAQYYLTAQPLRSLLLSWGIGALPQLSLMLLLKNLLFGFH